MKSVIEKLAGYTTFKVADRASDLLREGKKDKAFKLIMADEEDVDYLVEMFSKQLSRLRTQKLQTQSAAEQGNTLQKFAESYRSDFEQFPEILTAFLVAAKNAEL